MKPITGINTTLRFLIRAIQPSLLTISGVSQPKLKTKLKSHEKGAYVFSLVTPSYFVSQSHPK